MGYDRRLVGAIPLAAVVGGLSALLMFGAPQGDAIAQGAPQMSQQERSAALALEGAFIKIAEAVEPATVHVTVEMARPQQRGATQPPGGQRLPPPFGDLFQMPPDGPMRPRQASGSGVVVTAEGHILTNDHVIEGAQEGVVYVTLQDGTRFEGTVMRDFDSDIALIKIEAGRPLPHVRIADSSRVRVGQWAIAIGSPFGLQQTMTAGIVSALQRSAPIGRPGQRRYYPNLIQTDASINPGNSGGPLLNIHGELIGINVAIESPTGASAGIGFAIPSNTARHVMEQLIQHGRVTRGYLGLSPTDVPAGLRAELGTTQGAYISEVHPDTPADRAGIQVEDIVTRIGDREITGEIELRDIVAATPPGTRVPVTILRDGQPRTVQVEIGPRPDTAAAAPPAVEERPAGRLGIEARALTAELRTEMRIGADIRGIVVENVDPMSPAMDAGLRPRDIITAVNRRPITAVEELNQVVREARRGQIISLRVFRFTGGQEKPTQAVVNITVP